MRYRDASHVDVGSFYARRPRHGTWYRLIGYLALAAEILFMQCSLRGCIADLVVVLVLVWLVAWYQAVGTLWRSSLVAAIIAGCVFLSWTRCCPPADHGVVEVAR
jgi:hypothetical protein